MILSDFDYALPERLIAQQPATQRDGSRLLHVRAAGLDHLMFSQLQSLLQPGDLLVLNDTKVVKARLQGTKDTGGAAEVLLERVLEDSEGRSDCAESHRVGAAPRIFPGSPCMFCQGDMRLISPCRQAAVADVARPSCCDARSLTRRRTPLAR
mgnify:CR=1 FL=1